MSFGVTGTVGIQFDNHAIPVFTSKAKRFVVAVFEDGEVFTVLLPVEVMVVRSPIPVTPDARHGNADDPGGIVGRLFHVPTVGCAINSTEVTDLVVGPVTVNMVNVEPT